MAHIPEDARYVAPPSDLEVDEDAVTDEAVSDLWWHGKCPACDASDPTHPHDPDGDYGAWARLHAWSCTPLRAKAEDRLYGEGE